MAKSSIMITTVVIKIELSTSHNNDNVYGAVLMTMVSARVHMLHLMNAD